MEYQVLSIRIKFHGATCFLDQFPQPGRESRWIFQHRRYGGQVFLQADLSSDLGLEWTVQKLDKYGIGLWFQRMYVAMQGVYRPKDTF